MKRQAVICAVERGWQSSREFSLDLMRRGMHIDILIKGFVEKPVLDMITRYPSIKISAVRKIWFRPALFFKIASTAILGNLKGIVVESKRIEKWLYLASVCFKTHVFLLVGNNSLDIEKELSKAE